MNHPTPLRHAVSVAALVALCACIPKTQEVDCAKTPDSPICTTYEFERSPPKIYVDPPFGLSFTCVLLGCEETLVLRVQNRGGGTLAIPQVSLTSEDPDTRLDFSVFISTEEVPTPGQESLQATTEEPLKVLKDAPLYLHITYRPTDGLADTATLSVLWFDGAVPFEEATMNTVELAINARILDTATGKLRPPDLNFGYVRPGTTATEMIRVTNTSTSDAILNVRDARVMDGPPGIFEIGIGWNPLANPGETIEIPVEFTPTEDDVFLGAVEVITNDSTGAYTVPMIGTSINGPHVVMLEPLGNVLSFDEVRSRQTATRSVRLYNRGGRAATIHVKLTPEGSPFNTPLPPLVRLEPMTEMTFEVTAAPIEGGSFTAQLLLVPEGDNPPLTLDLKGFCNAPNLETESDLNFDPLVQGWISETYYLPLQNSGTSELLVSDVTFDVGSSELFRVAGDLPLPASLSPGDDPLLIPLVVTGRYLGDISGALLIHHNGIEEQISRVNLTGSIISCDEACPAIHASPDCSDGTCRLGDCDPGWHNSNALPDDGCECSEDPGGYEIGGVCSTGIDLGTLGDCASDYPSEVVRTGTLHSAEDIDLYFVRTEDAGGGCDFFEDSARTRVELVDAPPGLALCAVIQNPGNGCGGYTTQFDPRVCGQSMYMHDGSWGSGDSRELTSWVLWRPQAAPSCGTYTLRFRGED